MSQPAESPIRSTGSTAATASESASSSASAPFNPAEAVHSTGILIVDEDESFRLGLETFLKEYVGFEEIHTAANGLEALEQLREHASIEMITLDYQMPEMDGMTFLERVSEGEFAPLAVVMITGFPSDELALRFRGLDSERLLTEHFLEKPVDFNDLESVILSSYETLKRRQRDAADVAGSAAEEKSEEQKREQQARNIEQMFAGAPTSQDDDAKGRTEIHDDEFMAGGLGAPPEAAPEAAGVNEVRARIDWMGDTFNGRFDKLEAKVENISSRMPSMAERFWLGLLKWVALGLLAWGFVRFDFGDKLAAWYELGKAKLQEMSAAAEDSAKPAADDVGSEPADKVDGGATPASEAKPDSAATPSSAGDNAK